MAYLAPKELQYRDPDMTLLLRLVLAAWVALPGIVFLRRLRRHLWGVRGDSAI